MNRIEMDSNLSHPPVLKQAASAYVHIVAVKLVENPTLSFIPPIQPSYTLLSRFETT